MKDKWTSQLATKATGQVQTLQFLTTIQQIAAVDHNLKAVKLSSCGYETVTTKSRLNAILDEVKYGCRVFQKNFDWFVSYNDQVASFWDGMILIDADSLQIA